MPVRNRRSFSFDPRLRKMLKVSAKKTGTATITASVDGVEATATVTVTMQYKVTVYVDGNLSSETYWLEGSQIIISAPLTLPNGLKIKDFQGWKLNDPDADAFYKTVSPINYTVRAETSLYAIYRGEATSADETYTTDFNLNWSALSRSRIQIKIGNVVVKDSSENVTTDPVVSYGFLYTSDSAKATKDALTTENVGSGVSKVTNTSTILYATGKPDQEYYARGFVIVKVGNENQTIYGNIFHSSYNKLKSGTPVEENG